MKILVTVFNDKQHQKFEKDVHQLRYNFASRKFFVPGMAYDNYYEIEFEGDFEPKYVIAVYDRFEIVFEKVGDALFFSEWLEDANQKATEGFRNMAG